MCLDMMVSIRQELYHLPKIAVIVYATFMFRRTVFICMIFLVQSARMAMWKCQEQMRKLFPICYVLISLTEKVLSVET